MVQTSGYGQQGAAIPNFANEDPFAFINGRRGAKSLSFALYDAYGNQTSVPIGTSYTGVLAENPQVTPQMKFNPDPNATPEPDYYPDGNPKKQVRLALDSTMVFRPDLGDGWRDIRTLNTGEDGDEEDEGKRVLYVKDQMKQALADAQKAAGITSFGVGTRVIVRLIDQKPSQRGYAQKIYAIELSEIQPYVPEAVAQHQQEMAGALGGGQQQWAQAAPADPSQGVPQQQFVTPAQPTFPGQVVPAPQQAAPAVPQTPAGALPGVPVQQAPAATPALPNTGVQLPQVPVQQPVAPQAPAAQAPAPQAAPVDMSEAVQKLRGVIAQSVPREAALAGVAGALGIDQNALDQADQNTPF